MKFLGAVLLSIPIGFALGSCMRRSEWLKDRHKQVFGYWCEKSGGRNFRLDGWYVHCEYTVDKKGNVIWP
jgi:hypothetical protein